MGGALRSELRKLFTTKFVWGMALVVLLLSAGLSAFLGWAVTFDVPEGTQGGPPDFSDLELAQQVYRAPTMWVYLLALTAAALFVGSEERYKTVTSTALAVPQRWQTIVAKAFVVALMGLILGVTQLVGAVGAGSLVLTVNDAAAFPEPTELAKTFGAVLLAIVLWSLIGLGLGSVVSSPIVTVLIGVVGALVADVGLQIIAGFVDWIADVAPYLPGPATGALMGTDDQFLFWDALSQWQGGLVLLAYALVLTLVGIFIYRRKDVG